MFYYLKGTLVVNDGVNLVIDCNGVGYLMQTTARTAAAFGAPGGEVTAYTYFGVRQDAVDLFGFADMEELETFKLLLTVNGVGCKAAGAILSAITPGQLVNAIASDNSTAITKAQGVGPKLAARIVMELKDKINKMDIAPDEAAAAPVKRRTNNMEEAISALIVLGYRRQDAKSAVEACPEGLSTEQTIREALRLLMK